MEIDTLITHQIEWERIRGIDNPNDNLPRTLDELNEAFEETDPVKRLEEMVDVLIVLVGGMGKVCERLGIEPQEVNDLIEWKLSKNARKYDIEYFESNPTNTAITFVRHYWSHPEQWCGNDVY